MFTEENKILAIQENGLFYVLFIDTNDCLQKVEISETIYQEFIKFKRTIRNLQRSDERRIEYIKLTEIKLYTRSLQTQKSVEDIIVENEVIEKLYRAINSLPEKQRRRFLLYYVHGLTYKQIAELEKCSIQPIVRSIVSAKTNILKFF